MPAHANPRVRSRPSPRRLLWLVLIVACAPRTSPGDEPKAPPARLLTQWGRRGTGPGEFDFPIAIALAPEGEVFVTDFYNARVQRFGPDGTHRATMKVLPNPGGLARDAEGNLYITHFSAMKQGEEKKPDRVSVYSAEGRLLRQWGRTGKGDGEFDYPGGIAVTPQGRVYVADQTNRRVQVFDREGKFLFKWGEYGTKPGQFGGNITPTSRVGGPQFVAIDPEGNVYTTEGSMDRVQKFTPEGRSLLAWGSAEDKPGGFGGGWDGSKRGLHGPIGICLDGPARVWVGTAGGRVQQFTTEGRFLKAAGRGRGHEPGQFVAPHGLATDGRGNLFVVDSYNHRVQKLGVDP